MQTSMTMRQVILYEEEGGYWADCPSLPGCHTQGDTAEETLANMREAIQLYIEALEADGLPVPEESLSRQLVILTV